MLVIRSYIKDKKDLEYMAIAANRRKSYYEDTEKAVCSASALELMGV